MAAALFEDTLEVEGVALAELKDYGRTPTSRPLPLSLMCRDGGGTGLSEESGAPSVGVGSEVGRMKYEYKIVEAKNQGEIERKMNELGQEGYRLASFLVPWEGRLFTKTRGRLSWRGIIANGDAERIRQYLGEQVELARRHQVHQAEVVELSRRASMATRTAPCALADCRSCRA